MDSLWSLSSRWNTFWGQFQIELMGGIASSFIFLFLVLWFLRPRIKIAKFLCRVTPLNMQAYYTFKIVNHSFFSAHELRIELYKIRSIPMGDGNFNREYEKLSLLNGNISYIPSRPFFWSKNEAHPHCIIVRSAENLDTILSDDLQGISLRVSLKHGLTGLSKVFEQEFGNAQEIKAGKFKPGTKLSVV